MRDLIAKLEGLSGPSREVDAYVHAIAIGGRVHYVGESEATIERPIDGMWIRRVLPLRSRKIPVYTASLDAAIALVERVLPGHDWIVGHTNGGLTIHAQVGPNEMVFGEAPAIALLIALLRAKEAQDG